MSLLGDDAFNTDMTKSGSFDKGRAALTSFSFQLLFKLPYGLQILLREIDILLEATNLWAFNMKGNEDVVV